MQTFQSPPQHASKEICIHEVLTTISDKNASDTPYNNGLAKVSYTTMPPTPTPDTHYMAVPICHSLLTGLQGTYTNSMPMVPVQF